MNRDPLSALRERVQRIECPTATAHGVMPLGIAAIDRVLPGGGLAYGALHEILGTGGDEEDGALAAAFAAGIVGRAREGCGIVLWCLARPDPLRTRSCRARARPGAAGAGAGGTRRRYPVGDRGRAARIGRRRGRGRSRRLAGGGKPPPAARRRALRGRCFFIAALARRRPGGAPAQSAQRRGDALAHRGIAVAACLHSV